MRNNPDKVICKFSFNTVFCEAYKKSMIMDNIISSFRVTGIYPLDKSKVLDKCSVQESSLAKDSGIAYIPLYSDRAQCDEQEAPEPPTAGHFSKDELDRFHEQYVRESGISDDRYCEWKKVYHPLEDKVTPESSVKDAFLATPTKAAPTSKLPVLAKSHSSILHMFKSPPRLHPPDLAIHRDQLTASPVHADKLKELKEKEQKKLEAERQKKEREQQREQKKFEAERQKKEREEQRERKKKEKEIKKNEEALKKQEREERLLKKKKARKVGGAGTRDDGSEACKEKGQPWSARKVDGAGTRDDGREACKEKGQPQSDCQLTRCVHPSATTWVACDNCGMWFHCCCVNKKLKKVREIDSVCEFCH